MSFSYGQITIEAHGYQIATPRDHVEDLACRRSQRRLLGEFTRAVNRYDSSYQLAISRTNYQSLPGGAEHRNLWVSMLVGRIGE